MDRVIRFCLRGIPDRTSLQPSSSTVVLLAQNATMSLYVEEIFLDLIEYKVFLYALSCFEDYGTSPFLSFRCQVYVLWIDVFTGLFPLIESPPAPLVIKQLYQLFERT